MNSLIESSAVPSYSFDKETGWRIGLPSRIEPGKRVLCLYRVSTAKQLYRDANDEADIPMQRLRCREFAEQRGWTIVCELQEEGVSGHKVRAENRDKVQMIKEYATRGKFDMVPMLPWLLCAALLAVLFAAVLKLFFLRRDLDEIVRQLEERLRENTNAPIALSSGNGRLRAVASRLDAGLSELRRLRLRYLRGDRELKAAMAGVSHDLRTPLTAIFGYLELLEREELSQNARRYVNVIQERAGLLSRLTGELFACSVALAKPCAVSLEQVSVNAVLEQCVAAFYGQLKGRGIEPVVALPEEAVTRTLDRTALSRIFSNLLSNAVKYSAGDLRIALPVTGVVTFSNSAPGLSNVELSRLFDRFYTVETASGSTGLGLSVARSLARSMGASLTASLSGGILTVTLAL